MEYDWTNNLIIPLVQIMVPLFVAIFGYGVYLLRKYLAEQIGSQNEQKLYDFVQIIVRALEQEVIDRTGPEKKQEAIIAVKQFADNLGLEVDDDLIDWLIEYAVQLMNEKK